MLFLLLSILIIKWIHLYDNMLHIRQEREENQASAESQVDETTLYIKAGSGAKKRNLWEKKSKIMERKLNKFNKTLEIVCNCFNIALSDCNSDSENNDGGDAHQGPNTSNSRADEREEDEHDNRMIVSS
ncbi:hypothetical protein Tco_1177947 [Tanacetum coccineum]